MAEQRSSGAPGAVLPATPCTTAEGVVIDLDEVRRARPPGASRLDRVAALQVQDVGRTVRVQALERLSRR